MYAPAFCPAKPVVCCFLQVIRLMNTKYSFMLLAAFLFTAVPAPVAHSALNNDPAALIADSVIFNASSGPTFYGYVDYAVYAPGDYTGSLSFPDKFVYCYQIFNLPTSAAVSVFSVDLIPDAIVVGAFTDSASAAGVTGGSIPVPLASASMVSYFFGRNNVLANQHSTVLLFASDMGPTLGTATLTSSQSVNVDIQLPAPIPEPATLLMFALVAPLAC
jgi:hypothetical protein